MKNEYKTTELGEIPVEWDVVKLKDIGEFKNGINKKKEDFGKGYPFINLMNVFGTSVVKKNNLSLVNASKKELADYNLLKGDVLFIRSSVKPSGVGLTALIEENIHETVYSGFLIRFRDNGTLHPNYKRYCFYESGFRKRLLSLSSVSANTNINQNSLEGLLIAVPPLNEQKKIAAILNYVDDKIDIIEEQIKATEKLKKGLIQQLLTKGIGHTSFKESSIGMIPIVWEIKKIRNSIELISGYPFDSSKFNEESQGVKVLRGINITVGKLRWDAKIDRYWGEGIEGLEKYIVKENDIVISMDGSLVGRNYAKVSSSDLPLLLVQRVAIVRPNSNLSADYLFHILGAPLFINYVDAVKTSSGIPHISSKDINEFEIPFPPIEEQKRISELLNTVDERSKLYHEKLEAFELLKRGLMQILLTGRKRVNI